LHGQKCEEKANDIKQDCIRFRIRHVVRLGKSGIDPAERTSRRRRSFRKDAVGLCGYSVQRTVARLQGGMVFNAGEWQAKLGDGQPLRGYYSARLVREGDGVKIFEETVNVAVP
jgi:hypothetical protein